MGTHFLWAKGSSSSSSSILSSAGVPLAGEKAALPAFLTQTHLGSGQVPLRGQMGPVQALAWEHPARTGLRLESSPAAEGASGQLPAGTSSLSAAELGPSALPGSLPHTAAFLPAPPARTCWRSCWLLKLLRCPSGTLRGTLPPTQAHPTCRTPLAPQHSTAQQVTGSHSHLCLALHQPLQAPGAECPPLGKREGVQEGEQRCPCCWAGGPALGDRAQSRETLTARRRLSSFCRNLMEGRRVTRALLAPSGVLCSGKGQGGSRLSPKLPLLSCRAALPDSCPQLRGHLSPAGELCSPIWLRLEHPPGLPQQCAQPQLLQRPGAAEREEQQPQAPLPPSPWAGAGACTALPRGEGRTQGQDEAPWSRTEALPKPWLPLSCQSSRLCPSLLGTQR